MMWNLVIVIAFIALAVLGPLLGKDSRDGRDWSSSEPASPGLDPS